MAVSITSLKQATVDGNAVPIQWSAAMGYDHGTLVHYLHADVKGGELASALVLYANQHYGKDISKAASQDMHRDDKTYEVTLWNPSDTVYGAAGVMNPTAAPSCVCECERHGIAAAPGKAL